MNIIKKSKNYLNELNYNNQDRLYNYNRLPKVHINNRQSYDAYLSAIRKNNNASLPPLVQNNPNIITSVNMQNGK